MKIRIPLARPELTDRDRKAVMGVLQTAELSQGPKLAEFENAVRNYIGSRYAVAVNSGTSALHLAVRGLNLESGGEVVLPSFAFSAVLNVVLAEGLEPRFVDIDPATYNPTAESISNAITERTRLILAVHTFGFPLDIGMARSAIQARTRRSRPEIPIIEDACEALGAEVNGRKAGALADAGLFAFYPNKQITTGEGGVLVTSSRTLADRARRMRNQGRDPGQNWLDHAEPGFSYRLSDLNCALGISQLRRIEDIVRRRQKLAETYDRELARCDDLTRPPLTSQVGRISWFVYPVRLGAEFTRGDRDSICRSMLKRGIATGRYFAPLHWQPLVNKYGAEAALRSKFQTKRRLPNTDQVADRVIALPFFNQLTQAEIQEVSGALEESIRQVRRRM